MTEHDKQAALDMIAVRIAKADHFGLTATAQSWRDLYVTVATRPAKDIISIRDFTFEPTETHHANAARHRSLKEP